MNLQPIRVSMVVMACFLGLLLAAVFYFILGMSQATYLVTDGVRVGTQYLDKPRYDMSLQGLIFALSFLIAGALLLLLIILPDHSGADARRSGTSDSDSQAPQPRRQAGGQASGQGTGQGAVQQAQAAQAAAPAAAAPQVPPQAVESPRPEAAPAAAHQSSPLSIEGGEAEAEPVPAMAMAQAQTAEAAAPTPPVAAPPTTGASVEEEVLKSAAAPDLPQLDFEDSRFDDTGEEDVVYGNGRITEDAAWDFVQQYPDSATKFLYRKTLDNKQLSPTEDDIYRVWEMRGLTRAKVREIVLEIMRWQSLPDNFPHEIWRELRDQIYEIKNTAR